jgi:hypothetical protein
MDEIRSSNLAEATLASAKLETSKLPLSEDGKNVRALTTLEEDMKTRGQRHVNLIWEFTQAIIAVLVTSAMVTLAWTGKTSELLASAFGMIVGMYFHRTNHTKIGGVGGTDSRG